MFRWLGGAAVAEGGQGEVADDDRGLEDENGSGSEIDGEEGVEDGVKEEEEGEEDVGRREGNGVDESENTEGERNGVVVSRDEEEVGEDEGAANEMVDDDFKIPPEVAKMYIEAESRAVDIELEKMLNDQELFHEVSFINGKFSNPTEHDHKSFAVKYPGSHSLPLDVVALVSECGVNGVRAAVAAAQKALPKWASQDSQVRANLLTEWHTLMRENQEDLTTFVMIETGKPREDASAEIAYAASFVSWFAAEAVRVSRGGISGCAQRIEYEPVGVAALLTPWNFPAAMVTRKVAAALAAGCSVVLKPSELTPLTALALAELLHRAGAPAGVLNVIVSAQPAMCSRELIRHKAVRKLSFTGSTRVGGILLGLCATRILRTSMELGGNAPFVVFEDADIGRAADMLVVSKFARNAGQTCVSANRVYVQDTVYDRFLAQVFARVEKLEPFKYEDAGAEAAKKAPRGQSQRIVFGPMINERAVSRVKKLVEDACKNGAVVVAGGRVLEHAGPLYFAPTIVTGVTDTMRIVTEEIFGPIVSLLRFTDESEVIARANDTDAGLAAYVFSSNVQRSKRVSAQLQYGMVGVNTAQISDARMPFGGIKASGWGREGSSEGIKEYQNVKYLREEM